MIKFLRRAVILLFVFVLGVAGSSFLLNSETTDDRSDMNDPVFPEVMVDFDTSILMEGNDREYMRSQNEDYKAFSTEQIKFKDDAVYMIVY